LNGLGISNAEGLQYCINVENIRLRDNDLTDLPDFSGMDGLLGLYLTNNDFTAIPDGLFDAPGLEALWMGGCPISSIDPHIADITSLKSLVLSDTDLDSFPTVLLSMDLKQLVLDGIPIDAIPDEINHMTHLEHLSVDNTGLESLPETLFDITSLKTLEARGNEIESISSSVSELTNLYRLDLSHNKLGFLPDSICSFDGALDVSFNNLYSLPSHIGDHIDYLMIQGNRLTAIPPSVMSSPAVTCLDISLNRLTSLPSDFAERTFEELTIEFNFLDLSPGSPDRELLEANESGWKTYLRQLTPVKDLIATSSSDSVTLSWSPCPDGSEDDITWTVEGYVVYQYTGEMEKIADVDKSQTSFVHTGLTPETTYSYRVGVDYRVIDPGMQTDYTNRGYTAVEATTLVFAAAETISPVSPAGLDEIPPEIFPTTMPEALPSELPAAMETDIDFPGEENAGFPV
jgi:Leucine-rich repeat (LRR) protein